MAFWLTTLLIELVLFVALTILISLEEAKVLTPLMLLPAMWLARLLVARRRGRITRRLRFARGLGMPTTLAITGVEVIERERDRWGFFAYFVTEGAFCLVLWALMLGNMVVPHLTPPGAFTGDPRLEAEPTSPPMPTLTAAALPSFDIIAVHPSPERRHTQPARIARFSATGPLEGSERLIEVDAYPLRQLARDPARELLYATTLHRFGRIADGDRFEEIPVAEGLPALSWPSALAFDQKRRRLILMGRGVAYAYYPDERRWEDLPPLADLDLAVLAYLPAGDTLVGLEAPFGGRSPAITEAVAIDARDLTTRRHPLTPPIPHDRRADPLYQLRETNGDLVLLVIHTAGPPSGVTGPFEQRMVRIDPVKWQVARIMEGPEKGQ